MGAPRVHENVRNRRPNLFEPQTGGIRRPNETPERYLFSSLLTKSLLASLFFIPTRWRVRLRFLFFLSSRGCLYVYQGLDTLDNRFQVNRESIGSYSSRRATVACDKYRLALFEAYCGRQ